jgi:rhodanese-related sulfurtransferase
MMATLSQELAPQQECAVLANIGKPQMQEIVQDYETRGREMSGYVVLDVRQEEEIQRTGPLSPHSITFPFKKILQYQTFELSTQEFMDAFGFPKPAHEETLVFSCAAGGRSLKAAKLAEQSGYRKLKNYAGGSNDWFDTPPPKHWFEKLFRAAPVGL